MGRCIDLMTIKLAISLVLGIELRAQGLLHRLLAGLHLHPLGQR